jgi:hypothetical protein
MSRVLLLAACVAGPNLLGLNGGMGEWGNRGIGAAGVHPASFPIPPSPYSPIPLSQPRLRPPADLPCSRDELTSYRGRVTKQAITDGKTTLTIETDFDTTETVTIAHPNARDASAFYRLNGAPFTAKDWARIEQSPGRLRDGQRATAWVCEGGQVVVDWTSAAK